MTDGSLTVPISADLFDEKGPGLIGGRSRTDGRFVFPFPQGTAAAGYDRVNLGGQGRLWSWTVQRFRPKTPPYVETETTFAPFAVGYVQLDQIIVETRIVSDDFSELKIGLDMELVIVPYARTPDDKIRTTYAFRARGTGDRK